MTCHRAAKKDCACHSTITSGSGTTAIGFDFAARSTHS